MRKTTWLVLVGVAAAAALLVALPLPGPEPDAPAESPLAIALDSALQPFGNEGLQCATCHYAFLRPFEIEALLHQAGNDATYEVTIAPVSSYELAVVWTAPRRGGDDLAEPFASEHVIQLPPFGGSVRVPIDLPWPAAALVAEVRVPLEAAPSEAAAALDLLPAAPPHPRPPLALELVGPSPGRNSLGSLPNRHAVVISGEGGPLEGRWEAVVTALDPADAGRTLNLTVRAAPAGYDVRVDEGEAPGTRGRSHRFVWELPAPGNPGGPERFHVGVVAFNDHPTDRWTLPSAGDRAYHEGNISARQALVEEAPFTAQDIEAAWQGGHTIVLHEHTFDGVRTRVRNERGERFGGSLRTDGGQDVDVPVFPPMPPGTTALKVTLTWQLRSPASPAVNWSVAVTQRPDPTFRYPAPDVSEPGRLEYVLPVSPEEWERSGDGWLQAWPILELGEDDRAVFDGRYTFRVEALRDDDGGMPP